MDTCIFCAIAHKTIGADIILETDSLIAFHDINKAAPVHVLIIPKNHIASVAELTPEHTQLMGEIMCTASALAQKLSMASGFRVVSNVGQDGGQSVFHLHVHLLAGRPFSWPPG